MFIAERFPPDIGGLARSAARTAEALSRVGADVDVIALTRTLAPGALDSRAVGGVTLHRFGMFANLDLSLQHTLNLVEALHDDRAFEAVWGHYLFPSGFMAVMIGQLHGLTSTVSARGNDIDRMMFPPGDFSRLAWTLDRADVITAVSQELSHKIAVLSRREAVQIPNAVDGELFCGGPADAALKAELGIADDETVLGFCGELRHKKGFPFLLDALVRVRRERPACLLVIGEVRPRVLPHLQAFAAEHPEAAKRIVVSERIDDQARVAACYRLCDVYLQPSVWEGLPNALLEAMACERLVIASDAGAIREVIDHGENGFIIAKQKLNTLGEAVVEALDVDAASIARAARRRVLERYAPSHEEAALRGVLDRLGKRKLS